LPKEQGWKICKNLFSIIGGVFLFFFFCSALIPPEQFERSTLAMPLSSRIPVALLNTWSYNLVYEIVIISPVANCSIA